MGRGCGAVGRVVAYNTREILSSNPVIDKNSKYYQLYWKEKDEGKEAEKGPFKNMLPWWTLSCRFDIKSERSSIYAKDTA